MTVSQVQIAPGSKFTLGANVHAKRFDREMVVLDLDNGLYFSLDEIGAAIWEGFARGQSMGEILAGLSQQYQVSEELLLADTEKLVEKLVDAGLAVMSSDPPPP